MIHLVALVVNAHSPNPEIEFEVAHLINGEWYTNGEVQVWPFWSTTLDAITDCRDITIPEGWVAHLHEQARIYASNKPSSKEDKVNGSSLLASLGLPTKVHSAVSGTLKRRI